MPELHPILDTWLLDEADQNAPAASATPPAAPPPETRLQSAGGLNDGEARRIDTLTMMIAKSSLERIIGDVVVDLQNALTGTNYFGDKSLQLTPTLEHVHDCWETKERHLVEEMRNQVEKLGKAVDRWLAADRAAADAYDKGAQGSC